MDSRRCLLDEKTPDGLREPMLSRRAFPRRLAVAGACLSGVVPARQAAPDPLAGRWELNVARTHYGGGAEARRQELFTCAPAGTAVTCTIESVMADGRSVRAGFTARYDGTSSATRGISEADHVQLTRVSASIADVAISAIASPPPRGVAVVCELRSLGTSRTPCIRANLRICPVSTADMTSAPSAVVMVSTFTLSRFATSTNVRCAKEIRSL